MRPDQLFNGPPQQVFAAEVHAERPDLLCINLVSRSAVQRRDLALALGKLLGNARYPLLRDVNVVAIERLPCDDLGVGAQQGFDRPRDILRVDFLAAAIGTDRLALEHLADEVEPATIRWRMCDAIYPRRPQGTDRPAVAQPVAVHELLEGRFVGTVMARWPQGMPFVECTIPENDVVHGTCRDEDEARDADLGARTEQAQGAREVDALKYTRRAMAAGAAGSRPFPLDRRVHDRVYLVHECPRRRFVVERASEPVDGVHSHLLAVTAWPVPATQPMPPCRQFADDVAPKKARGSGDGNAHPGPSADVTWVAGHCSARRRSSDVQTQYLNPACRRQLRKVDRPLSQFAIWCEEVAKRGRQSAVERNEIDVRHNRQVRFHRREQESCTTCSREFRECGRKTPASSTTTACSKSSGCWCATPIRIRSSTSACRTIIPSRSIASQRRRSSTSHARMAKASTSCVACSSIRRCIRAPLARKSWTRPRHSGRVSPNTST